MKEQMEEIIEQLMILPKIIISHPQEVAFSLGIVTAQLENLTKTLTYGNGEF